MLHSEEKANITVSEPLDDETDGHTAHSSTGSSQSTLCSTCFQKKTSRSCTTRAMPEQIIDAHSGRMRDVTRPHKSTVLLAVL